LSVPALGWRKIKSWIDMQSDKISPIISSSLSVSQKPLGDNELKKQAAESRERIFSE